METTPAPHTLTDRLMGAARLKDAIYEEVEADTGATGQAAFVVVGTSIAAAAGAASTAGEGLVAGVGALIGWGISAFFAYLVGTRLLPGANTKATWGQLARTMGFAQTPRFLLLLGIIPGLRALVAFVVGVWVLAATVVALRAALDTTTGRAIAVGLVAWLAQLIVFGILLAIAAGIGYGAAGY